MKLIRPFLSVLFAFGLTCSVFSQSEDWLHLPKGFLCRDIAESAHHLWIADYSGLTRINRETHSKKHWSKTNSPFDKNAIDRVLVNNKDNFWVWPHSQSFFHFDNDKWQRFDVSNSPLSDTYKPACLDKDGMLWVADTTLFFYDGKDWQSVNYDFSEYKFYTYGIESGKNGTLWLTTNKGLYSYAGGSWQRFHYHDDIIDHGNVDAIQIDEEGRPWLLHKKGLYYLDNGAIKRLHATPDELTQGYTSFSARNETDVWLGTAHINTAPRIPEESGAYHFDGKEWKHYSHENSGLGLQEVLRVHIDKDDNVWFGGNPLPGQINTFTKKSSNGWQSYIHTTAQIPCATVQRVRFYNNGAVIHSRKTLGNYRGAGSEGLTIFSKGKWQQVPLPIETIFGFTVNPQGDIYARTRDTLRIYKSVQAEKVSFTEMRVGLDEYCDDVLLDSNGNIWMDYVSGSISSTNTYNLAKYDGEKWQTYDDDFPESFFLHLKKDHKNKLWATNHLGIYSLEKEGFQLVQVYPENFPGYDVPFCVDINQHLWFPANHEGDIFEFDGDEWILHENLFDENGFRYDINSDSKGNIWLKSQNRGLYKFDGKDWIYFNAENAPLPANNLDIDADNHIWMTNSAGILIYREGGVSVDLFETEKTVELLVYPNPFSSQIHINLPQTHSDIHLEMRNINGQLLLTKSYKSSSELHLEVGQLSAGIYLLSISTAEGKKYKTKLICHGE